MDKNSKKNYQVFVGHPMGVATDLSGTTYRNEWIKAVKLNPSEEIKAVRFDMDRIISGYMPVIGSSNVGNLVARVLHVLDAANTNEALKDLVKEKIWAWFDEKVREVSE